MTRSCDTCEWAHQTNRLAIGPTGASAGITAAELIAPILACVESPQHIEVRADHFCGRWRPAERLIGRDKRVRT